ncbi:MAG: hypothetical protein JSS34_02055 [Proteobacteria bacterium]|nr:hypothetical protein [Pseudomonadota bacterium]
MCISTKEEIERLIPKGWPKNGLLVFPEMGRGPYLKAISSAKKKIEMAAYKLSDPNIIKALVDLRRENSDIEIDLLIQPETFAHEKSGNVVSPIEFLRENGIKVHILSGKFNQAHYKMLLIDGKWGIVSTGNLDQESFDGLKSVTAEPCRDFALTITNAEMIQEMSRVFQADIHHEDVVPTHPFLVWGPDQQRHVFSKMIKSATRSIRIYQQDFQDMEIAQLVANAAATGIRVEVIMIPYPFSKTKDNNIPNQQLIRKAGGHVYLHGRHYIHAKMLLIDAEDPGARLLCLTSCNFYTPSLNGTRELGVQTRDEDQIRAILGIFECDKKA